MQKLINGKHEELIPANKYICDIEETFVCEGLSAKHIDENMYKDITDEEAEAIMEKINKEAEDNGKEEN